MGHLDPARLRQIILEQSKRAGVGHIGSALSLADILCVLYSGFVRVPGQESPERDLLILSKGHAALALYGALYLTNVIDLPILDTYCEDGSLLGVHPEHQLAGVDFSTGSLGMGLSIGAGAALGASIAGDGARTFVIVSDAELNEGSTWEAVMFAGHHKLAGLVVIIDDNGSQALGQSREILALDPVAPKWRGFGWNALEVDGHDPVALSTAFTEALGSTMPTVIVAQTILGKGVSFMENDFRWHYLPLADQQYEQAMAEISA